MHEELKHTSVLETLCIQQPRLRFNPKQTEALRPASPPLRSSKAESQEESSEAYRVLRPATLREKTIISRTPEQSRKRPRPVLEANISAYSDFGGARNLEAGFLPETLVKQLKEARDWRDKVAAVKQIEQTFRSQSQSDLRQHIKPFVDFLNEALPDLNLTVTLTILQMIDDLLTSPNLSKAADWSVLLPNCLEKFGDSRIAVRQMTFKVFKQLLEVLEPSVLLPKILQGLYSPNWHIREEVMHIFLVAILSKRGCDSTALVQPVAMMLDDCKTKVRSTAIETLSAIAQVNKSSAVMKEMETLLDKSVLYRVEDRVRARAIPVINDTGISFRSLVPRSTPTARVLSQTPRNLPTAYDEVPIREPTSALRMRRLTPISDSLRTPPQRRKVERDLSVDVEMSSLSQSTNSTPMKHDLVRKLPAPEVLDPGVKEAKLPMYLQEDEIPSLAKPAEAAHLCMNAGGLTEWTDQFQMLNNLRSLIKNHPAELLVEGAVHKIILTVLKWADSLRSSLAKNALIVLGELFQGLGTSVDSELDIIVSCLMRKCVDTNVFLAAEADKALLTLCNSCSLPKVLVTLLSLASGPKNPAVKAKTAMCFGLLFKRAIQSQVKLKDIDRILKLLAGYVIDAAPEVRAKSREALGMMMEGYSDIDEFFKLLSRNLSKTDFLQVKEALSRTESPSSPTKARSVKVPSRNRTPQKQVDTTARDLIDETLRTLESKASQTDWRNRYEALSELEVFVIARKASLNPTSQVFKVTELLAQGMKDGNMKVSVHALSTFNRLIPELRQTLSPHLGMVVGLLMQACVSTNTSVRKVADTAWAALRTHTEVTALFTATCSHARTAPLKVQQKVACLILPILGEVHRQRPRLLEQYAAPLCTKLTEGEMNSAGEDLQRALRSFTY
jgi:hypothetical protein